MKKILLVFGLLASMAVNAQEMALLKYSGGGDWYANPTALPNLARFCNEKIRTKLTVKNATVTAGERELFSYPFVHMTGHGNVVFSDAEIANLRAYLLAGGFLHIDDNYGMDQYVRREIKRLFPNHELVELGANHEIFQQPFVFASGLPKIHEHDAKPPQAFGIVIEGRLALLYTYETDLGDGWEDPEVHNNPPAVREKALRMGANIVHYVFNR